jgi:hypothetical protein
MAATATERKAVRRRSGSGGAGEWIDVGRRLGGCRVAKGGADETRRARRRVSRSVSARRTSARRSPSRSPVRSAAGTGGRPHDLRGGRQADEGGACQAARDVDLHLRSGVARTPARLSRWTASQAGEGTAFTLRVLDRGRRRDLAVQLPAQPRRTQDRAAPRGCPSPRAATQTLSALLLAELEEEAGLPPGWLSVVVGPASESATCSSRTSGCG